MKDAYMALLRGSAEGLPATWGGLNVHLVHGTVDVLNAKSRQIKRGDHAWLEVQADQWTVVWDPQHKRTFSWEDYQRALRAVANHRYTRPEALQQYAEAHHTGPWQ